MIAASAFLAAPAAALDPSSVPTVTTLTANGGAAAQVASGETVTFVATISSDEGAPVGSAVFYNVANGLPISCASLTTTSGAALTVTCTTSSLPNGTTSVVAQYVHDPTDWFSPYQISTSAPVSVTVSSGASIRTALTLSADPEEPKVGEPVTLRAVVTPVSGSGVPTGSVRFDEVRGTVSTLLGTATLDATGAATLVVPAGFPRGEHTIFASYQGDAAFGTAGGVLTLEASGELVVAVTTQTTLLVNPTQIRAGEAVTLVAQVKQVGEATQPLADDSVTFSTVAFNGQPLGANAQNLGSARTVNGVAILTGVGGWLPGTYVIQASYVGNLYARPSSGTVSLTVLPPIVPTSLELTGAASGVHGEQASLSARLLAHGQPLAGRPVTLALGSLGCDATTDAAGVATCAVVLDLPAGSYPLTASFAGTITYSSSSAAGTFTVQRAPSTLALEVPASVVVGSEVTLAAILTGGGEPLVGRPLTLSLAGVSCVATTGVDGRGACSVAAPGAAGAVPAAAEFGGDESFAASQASGSVDVERAPSALALEVPASVVVGSEVTLAAILTGGGGPLAGRSLTLSLGGSSCVAVTGADGRASCAVTAPEAAGTVTATAAFAGDDAYAAAEASVPVAISEPADECDGHKHGRGHGYGHCKGKGKGHDHHGDQGDDGHGKAKGHDEDRGHGQGKVGADQGAGSDKGHGKDNGKDDAGSRGNDAGKGHDHAREVAQTVLAVVAQVVAALLHLLR